MTPPLGDATRQFLDGRRFAVLATINRDGTPQQSTIWYELQGDEIMMNTKRGRLKERNLRRDPRCSICIEDEYTWVTLGGAVTLIDDQEIAQADIKRLAICYDGAESAEHQVRNRFSKEERVTIRLRIERVTGEGLSE
jgi:PPOX class probable F420-dependent enzyme